MYVKDPNRIETGSMEIIEREMRPHSFGDFELQVVKRMIHSTGDFDYQDIVRFVRNPLDAGARALKAGCRIVTDTTMAYAGINKRILKKARCSIDNYVAHEEVFRLAERNGTTRSIAAVEFAARQDVGIFVVGNAPTALFRLGELILEKRIAPQLIVGVPVGFVGAAESKEYIRSLDVPSITTVGRKGGSNVAAAILNAILYSAIGRDG